MSFTKEFHILLFELPYILPYSQYRWLAIFLIFLSEDSVHLVNDF